MTNKTDIMQLESWSKPELQWNLQITQNNNMLVFSLSIVIWKQLILRPFLPRNILIDDIQDLARQYKWQIQSVSFLFVMITKSPKGFLISLNVSNSCYLAAYELLSCCQAKPSSADTREINRIFKRNLILLTSWSSNYFLGF